MTVFGGGELAGRPAAGWFGTCPSWVDTKLPPGATSQNRSGYGAPGWWQGYVKLSLLLPFTPNLVWLIMTFVAYFVFPYDYDGAAWWSPSFLRTRAAVNVSMTWAYYGFWHWGVYGKRWARRKFDRSCDGPTLARMVHNVWYSTLGALQWTAWECVFAHLYATGKVDYLRDGEAFGTATGIIQTTALILLVPVFREIHFYCAHRLIHFRALYRYVHSLHHRNSDPEPFSGLAMHPIEHLYYYACMAAPLYVTCSPIVMAWIGLHAAISPACPHSGHEDHWHSDQFHYVHHARFDCNFGIPAVPLDRWFGTYREHCVVDAPATPSVTYLSGGLNLLWALPESWDHAVYDSAVCAVMAMVMHAATDPSADVGGCRRVLPWLLAVGPVALGQALCAATGDRVSWRWPFLREKVIGAAGFHCLAGVLLCVLPVAHTCHLLLK
eukprot:TRINITY_DN3001_c0_g1_i1.p1 TRINITY_DN3001_c0_g1~~TRINITY_DN3001_c0_g1_i1.p1  ORF type:complete len:438 (+),score=73.36 TRINITY_DN3001_c0_g1_i1:66-1379(+)